MERIDHRGQERDGLRVGGCGVAWLVPLLLLIGLAGVDLTTGERFRVVSWIVLVPSVAAALCGVATTVVFALLSLATYVAVDTAFPDPYRAGNADFVLVALGGALAVVAAELRARRERREGHMRDIAETTRRTVLRPLPAGWAGLEHAGVYLAADTDARVGGDFYDIQPGPHGTRVLVGDVQGKGLGAVETAAALLGTFREAAYHEPDLATVADRLEIRMYRHRGHTAALGRYDGERFATGVLLGFSEQDGDTVEVINFGHEAPLAVGPHGVRPLPGTERLPIGFGHLTGDLAGDVEGHLAESPKETPAPALHPDETLLVVTDGVTEARDRRGEFYALVRELEREVARDPGRPAPDRLVRAVRDGVLRHTRGRLADDTTVFAVRRLPEVSG
ncbi:PP2C family protein-serine/threonine phosphatase [Streptomyces sp. LaPpAH-108]|uniref:PP2C family protein-serine/threonine phosphatase n=1 Tax=Streptomyces sp. LaPpAH-108 TaxID=1155714 RepID=UPI0003646125|nr:PP2C family protein-serine/threonine phosphatase [Streptomyces sp. LaPpAH-108]